MPPNYHHYNTCDHLAVPKCSVLVPSISRIRKSNLTLPSRDQFICTGQKPCYSQCPSIKPEIYRPVVCTVPISHSPSPSCLSPCCVKACPKVMAVDNGLRPFCNKFSRENRCQCYQCDFTTQKKNFCRPVQQRR